ncbi:MAG: hypothetical protein HS115_05610 [Spirochaetales bacterium]|nr:hypothetical protein [Spirochaetales bacterium]
MKEPEIPPESLSTERFLLRIGLFFLVPVPLLLLYLAHFLQEAGAMALWLRSGLHLGAALLAFSGMASVLFGHYKKLERSERSNYRSRWLFAWILLALRAIAIVLAPNLEFPEFEPYREILSAAFAIGWFGVFLFYWVTELSLRWQRKAPIPPDFYFWGATATALFFGPLLY